MKFYKVNGLGEPQASGTGTPSALHCIVRDNGENYTYLYKNEVEGGTYNKPFRFTNYKEIEYPADFPEKWRPALGDKSPKTPESAVNEKENMKIYTKFDEYAAPLVQKLVEERGMSNSNKSPKNWYLGCGPHQSFDHLPNPGIHKDYKEVSLIEFLTSLAAIPVPFKPKIINILPWKVEIKGDKSPLDPRRCDIGCRKDVSEAKVQELIEEIDSLEGERLIDIGDKEFDFAASRSGFRVDGAFVPWNTWDAFKAEYSLQTSV
jgi:hypothetical protein